jgi:hypothetical protein
MKKYLLSASIVMLVVTAGCATLTAPEETKALKYATSVFTTGIGEARSARTQANAAMRWEALRSNIATGSVVPIFAECMDPVDQWRNAFLEAYARPDDWRNIDAVYARRLTLRACDFARHDTLPPAQRSIEPSLLDTNHRMSVETADLATVTQHLNAYVEALADIATGESSAALDGARAKAATAAKGLAGALDSSGIAGSLVGFIGEIADSLIAARRNAETRNFLRGMDQAMPHLMEQLGLAARYEIASALLDRATAAQSVAVYGNQALGRVARGRNARRQVDPERLRRFDEMAGRLETHNGAFRQLRLSDPMIAARGFAKAHRALTAVFSDPRRNRIAFLTAFQEFQTSANALVEALNKASDD